MAGRKKDKHKPDKVKEVENMSPEETTRALAEAVTTLIKEMADYERKDVQAKQKAINRFFSDAESIKLARRQEYYEQKEAPEAGGPIFNLVLPFGGYDNRFLIYNTHYETLDLGESKQTVTDQTEFTNADVAFLKQKFKHWDLNSFRKEPILKEF